MIPELREGLYQYLISGGAFISLLGAGNLSYMHVKNNKDYPYCIFYQRQRNISPTQIIDSADKFPDPEVVFEIYTGSNDKVKESFVSPSEIEDLTEALISQLDLKDSTTIPIDNYYMANIELIDSVELKMKNNSTFGAAVFFRIILQKAR